MSEHPPELSRLIAAHRQVRRPSPQLRERVALAIEAERHHDHRMLRRKQWIGGGLTGALLGLAALLVMHWIAAGRITRGAATRVPDQAQHQRLDRSEPSSTSSRPTPTAVPRTDSPAPAPASSAATEPPAVVPRAPRPRSTETSAEVPHEPSAEVRLLREAEVALSTDPGRALALLREHEHQFPRTALALERRALRILASCAADPSEAAQRERDAFLEEQPDSAYARRVRAACR